MAKDFNRIQIQDEPGHAVAVEKIKKIDPPADLNVRDFEFQKIHRKGEKDYSEGKRKYGAFAATDADRKAKGRKEQRFFLSPLLRGPLGVDEEEKRAIEERVRARIQAVSDEAHARASEEGFKEGWAKGHEEAFQKFRDECQERIKQVDQIIGTLEKAKHQIFSENERFLVELVFQVAKTVMLKELETDRDYIARLSRDIIEKVGIKENITIRVHPKDVESLELLKEGIAKSLGNLQNVTFEITEQVKLGGCKIESQWNAIDASLETQIQSLYEGLIAKKNRDVK